MISERRLKEMHDFWKIIDPLEHNEVYVLLLIGKKKSKRSILDTVLIKTNQFEEFFNKTSVLINKANRVPFETELLFDINRKDVREGLESGWIDIRSRINKGKDVTNFFQAFLKNIRYSQITDYILIKDSEPLYEMSPEFIIKHKNTYYNIFDKDIEEGIHKPEIPVPGTIQNGEEVNLYYASEKRRKFRKP